MKMGDMKIQIFKNYYALGHWNLEMLNDLKNVNFITEQEYSEIIKTPKATRDARVEEAKYNYEFWDGVSPINGVPAEEIRKKPTLRSASKILLIINLHNNNIDYVESMDTIRGNERLKNALSDAEVAEYYVQKLIETKNNIPLDFEGLSLATNIYIKAMETHKMDAIYSKLTEINDILKTLTKE